MNESDYLMWLLRVPGVGSWKAKQLIDTFNSAENVFNLDNSELKSVDFLDEDSKEALMSEREPGIVEKYVYELNKIGARFIPIDNEEYPELLKEIYDPPQGIYVKGKLPDENFIKIAMVGTRSCTDYGLKAAYKLSRELAENGFVIVSGMALGIDGMSHRGAIDGKGLTIAVLGCGVDICYPKQHVDLRDEILENGCLISEFPPDTAPIPRNFPVRNRIISGLSRGVILVEAPKRSGANITVDQAFDQGREVFAVPGRIFDKQSEGANRLLKENAWMATSYEDILFGLGTDSVFSMRRRNAKRAVDLKRSKQKLNNRNKKVSEKDIDIKEQKKEMERRKEIEKNKYKIMSINERKIYDCIGDESEILENIIMKTGLDMQEVNKCLTMMEINRHISRLPGQKIIKLL